MAAAAERYVTWIVRRRRAILAVAAAISVASAVLALGMPLRTDLRFLLPPGERSVQDLEVLEQRTRAIGVIVAVIVADDAGLRARAAADLEARLRALPPSLVSGVDADDRIARRFAWDHRFLFAPLADLERARAALADRIEHAKLAANPAYVDFEDDGGGAGAADTRLDDLRQKLHDAEEGMRRPQAMVSDDATMQLLIVHAPFASSSIASGREMVNAVADAAGATRRAVGPGVDIGLADDVVTGVAEERAVLDGMLLALIVTTALVGAALVLYFRTLSAVAALLAALAAGTLATFGFARLAVGYLNSATAFLSAIVIGNGINFGIILLARYLEERRHSREDALAIAVAASLRGTLAAALAAGVAYASLILTDFRGFRDFGVIGGAGMLLCWLAAYTVLPAALAVIARRGGPRLSSEPGLGRVLARLVPRRPGVAATVGALVVAACGAATWRYLTSDPYEYDWERLRSTSAEAMEAREWMDRVDKTFGHGLAGGFAVGVDRAEDVARVVAVLRAHEETDDVRDEHHAAAAAPQPRVPLFRKVSTLDDFLPPDQPAKLQVLAALRRLLTDDALAELDETDRADARRFRPPADLVPLTRDDLPEPLVRPFVEKDGTRGRIILADQSSRFNGWNGHDTIAFARAARALDFPAGTHIGGSAFVFADILEAVARDGPRATLAALAGMALFVLLVVGWGRHALVTIACSAAGTAAMLACAWLFDLRVNFLDFAALPITLGISVDYAVNIVVRERADGPGSARQALATTGGAVVLASFTTVVGYGSLLLSANRGIRSFGLAAIVGEATCLIAALALAPALLSLGRPAPPRAASPE